MTTPSEDTVSDIERDYREVIDFTTDVDRVMAVTFPLVRLATVPVRSKRRASGPAGHADGAAHAPTVRLCLNGEKRSEGLDVVCEWAAADSADAEYDVQIAVDKSLFHEHSERLPWKPTSARRGRRESGVNFYSSRIAGQSPEPVSSKFVHWVPYEVLQAIYLDFEDAPDDVSPAQGAARVVYVRVLVRESIGGVPVVLPSDMDGLAIGRVTGSFDFFGLRGDVIRVDLSAIRSERFGEPRTSEAGAILRDEAGEVVSEGGKYADTGILFVAPAITVLPTTTSAPAGGPANIVLNLSVEANGSPHDREFTIEVGSGYSSFGLNGSVGLDGDNRVIDVARVQQRLKYFNFRGEKPAIESPNPLVVVDGRHGLTTMQAIRLFQAATQPDGLGNPAVTTGRVGSAGRDLSWLNATNAPWWLEVERSFRGGSINQETWATSWTMDILTAARDRGATLEHRVQSLSEYPDMAPPGGHRHGEHKGGHSIDWGTGNLQLRNSDAFPAGRPRDRMYQELTAEEKQVVDCVRTFHDVAGGQFANALFGGTGGEASFPRIRQVINAYGPEVTAHANHDDHVHIRLRPPAQGPPAEVVDDG